MFMWVLVHRVLSGQMAVLRTAEAVILSCSLKAQRSQTRPSVPSPGFHPAPAQRPPGSGPRSPAGGPPVVARALPALLPGAPASLGRARWGVHLSRGLLLLLQPLVAHRGGGAGAGLRSALRGHVCSDQDLCGWKAAEEGKAGSRRYGPIFLNRPYFVIYLTSHSPDVG